MEKEKGILSEVSKITGKEIDEIDFYIVVVNGEIEASFIDEEEASAMVNNIIDSNTSDVIRESGRDEEDLTEREYREMVFWGGFEGDNAYYEYINIDEDIELDKEYTTEQDDSFTYRDLLLAFNSIKETDDLLDEITDYDADDEYEDDEDEDIF